MSLYLPGTEAVCEQLHDEYERAASRHGWATQEASRVSWAELPEANKATMRDAVQPIMARIKELEAENGRLIDFIADMPAGDDLLDLLLTEDDDRE